MKNAILILSLSLLWIGCTKDSRDSADQPQDFTVTISVDPNHYFNPVLESKKAFLSDENGNILASGALNLGQTTTLSFNGNVSGRYDLSYMSVYNIPMGHQKEYILYTLTNIQQGTYTLGPGPLIENTHDEIYINLNKTGYPCEATSGATGIGTFGPGNGGYYNFRANLVGSPTSDFYTSFNSPNDQYDRYFWKENVLEGSVFNIDYTTLPKIQNIVNTQIPSNDYCYFSLEGLKNNDVNNIHHSLALGNFAKGISSLSFSVPLNVFDTYLLNVHFRKNQTDYFKHIRTDDLPTTIDTPALDFTVNNPSPQNFNMSTTGNATIFEVIFGEAYNNAPILFSQTIYGEAKSEISFSKENLRMNIQQLYPDLVGFGTLPLSSVGLIYYSPINSYNTILKYRIESETYEIPELNGFVESISKNFN